ncbi:MAG: YceI family protein [Gemmatimonadota bacterium]|nr:YceI family protein [Gemmatimonadota bacterium]
MKHRRSNLAALVAVALLMAGVVWFVVLPDGSGDRSSPVVVSAPELEAADESQRVFRIDPNRSTARYQAFEEFLDATVGSPVGETSAIAGDILVEPGDPEASRSGTIVVNVESLASDSRMRDSRLRKAYLESAAHPEVEMRFGRLLDPPRSFEEGEEYNLRLEGDLTVKGIRAPTVWDVSFAFEGAHLRGSARTEVLMSTYGVGPISIAGLLNTRDEVVLSIDLVAYDVASGAGPEGSAAGRLAVSSGQAGVGPSFAEEIFPILTSSCASCHQPGHVGSGHWSLATAVDAAGFAEDLALVTRLGYMPPWKPGGATPQLRHDLRLRAEQRASLREWAAAGAPLDVAASTPVLPGEAEVARVRADLVLGMPEPYQGTGELSDDYRCFVLDPGFEEDTFLTGFSLEPGERRVVHHSLVYLAGADARDEAAAAAGRDARPGWECFGGPGIPEVGGVIASWVPGQTAMLHPEGTGFLLPAGSFFVFQLHYNYEEQVLPDQTGLVLQTERADGDVLALQAVPLIAPVEIPCSDPGIGPQCDRFQVLRERREAEGLRAALLPDLLLRLCGHTAEELQEQDGPTVTSWCDIPMRYAGTVLEVGGHMHTMGSRFSLTLNPDTDGEQPLFEIPQWDFNWQGRYEYEAPIHVAEGDVIRISCTWFKGTGETQRYTTWGEGTLDEMCLSSLTVLPDDPDSVPSRRFELLRGFSGLLDRVRGS